MVRRVIYNVRHLAKTALRARLETISQATGYNTDPRVVTDYRHPDRGEVIIWVDSGSEIPESNGVSGITEMVLTILITGIVHIEPDQDTEELDALLQDIRTCVGTYAAEIQSDIVVGSDSETLAPLLYWGPADTDQGILREEAEAMVVQTLFVKYLNSREW